MTEIEPQRFEFDDDAPYPSADRVATRTHYAMTEFLRVERDGPGVYRVFSGSGRDYLVDLESGICDCPDTANRGPWCKHYFAVLFQTGELPAVVGTGVVTDESADTDADHAEADDEQLTEDGDDHGTETLTERVEHFAQQNPGTSAIEAISQLGINPDKREEVEEVLA